jgi:hypothetical protein
MNMPVFKEGNSLATTVIGGVLVAIFGFLVTNYVAKVAKYNSMTETFNLLR